MTETYNPLLSPMAASGEASFSSSTLNSASQPPPKKKRNLPGMPDPDAEVIALSPTTLMATNRFVCEICNKGFQREQNLQLHRRGHNLPWKLRQRSGNEVRKKVYVCPEPSCVHHHACRALGDLTGIKKHFSRKHGEKKWKCERCSKKYAVQSDWKAHIKTCGTKEYKCDCGTFFSRRDSFVTHRAFCDALAEEARAQTLTAVSKDGVMATSSPPLPPLTPSTSVLSPTLSIQSSEIPENPKRMSPPPSNAVDTGNTSIVMASSTTSVPSSFSNLISSISALERTSLSLSTSSPFNSSSLFHDPHYTTATVASPQPALSATALLQKAAQMGSSSSNASLFHALGLTTSSSSNSSQDHITTMPWNTLIHIKQEDINHTLPHNLGLGLASGNSNAGFADVMMRSSSDPFGGPGQPTMTRDLLGLSIGNGASLPSFFTSFGGNFQTSGDRGGGAGQ
ncbi:hypothetical protein Lal_00020238 [Lupinus albus]|uniref:Putative transcription factor C2H2 family n=1 Tax=Lupinus albus TaxID=3870 RepID=A0A6A5MLG1_LUPAL|nr:putative transcription factor C2H2 family [Lupinus albus]KAF1871445.1 hypothetical protein Lal_00020238 [Lupinus albus]